MRTRNPLLTSKIQDRFVWAPDGGLQVHKSFPLLFAGAQYKIMFGLLYDHAMTIGELIAQDPDAEQEILDGVRALVADGWLKREATWR